MFIRRTSHRDKNKDRDTLAHTSKSTETDRKRTVSQTHHVIRALYTRVSEETERLGCFRSSVRAPALITPISCDDIIWSEEGARTCEGTLAKLRRYLLNCGDTLFYGIHV